MAIYLILVSELRGDVDRYRFSCNYAYQTLEQANARFDQQVSIHGKPGLKEIVEASPEIEAGYFTGERWHTVFNQKTSKARIRIELQPVFEIYDHDSAIEVSRTMDRSSLEEEVSPYGAEHDLVNHIFVVATNHVQHEASIIGKDEFLEPTWSVDSIHFTSQSAVLSARQLWTLEFEHSHGSAVEYPMHYGLYRHVQLPQAAAARGIRRRLRLSEITGPQIRVERVRVTLPRETVEKDAITYQKPWRPLCAGREAASLQRLLEEYEDNQDKALFAQYLPRSRQAYADSQRAPLPTKKALERILAEQSKRQAAYSITKTGKKKHLWSKTRNLVDLGQNITNAAVVQHGGSVLKPQTL